MVFFRLRVTRIYWLPFLLGMAGCSVLGQLETGFPTSPVSPTAVEVAGLITPAANDLPQALVTPSLPASPSPLPASPTPTPSLQQLTTGGCCVDPFWSPDGQSVLFLDRPAADAAPGFWGVKVEGGEPELFTGRLGYYSTDMQYRVFLENGQTVVEQLQGEQRWVIPSGGRPVALSPDNTHATWTVGQDGPPFDISRNEIWISQVDGTEARPLLTVFGGGQAAWFPDGRLLIRGRTDASQQGDYLWIFSSSDGSLTELVNAHRIRGVLLSPGGSWAAYQVTFSSNEAENGLWLVNTQTRERLRVEPFGAYRWRDDHRLLVVPQDMSSPLHRIWQVDGRSPGTGQFLTDPLITPFRIANNDWAVAPGGGSIAFVSAEDQNIWLLNLPD